LHVKLAYEQQQPLVMQMMGSENLNFFQSDFYDFFGDSKQTIEKKHQKRERVMMTYPARRRIS
jgi:hypothetical protein